MERSAKLLIVAGIGLFGIFAIWARWTHWSNGMPFLERLAHSREVFSILLAMATVLVFVGTAALLRRPPSAPGRVRFSDLAFVVIGLIASGLGVCVVGTSLVEYLVTH
jgi:hypothetical protein